MITVIKSQAEAPSMPDSWIHVIFVVTFRHRCSGRSAWSDQFPAHVQENFVHVSAVTLACKSPYLPLWQASALHTTPACGTHPLALCTPPSSVPWPPQFTLRAPAWALGSAGIPKVWISQVVVTCQEFSAIPPVEDGGSDGGSNLSLSLWVFMEVMGSGYLQLVSSLPSLQY